MASFQHPSFQRDDDDDDRWEPLEQEEYSIGAPVVSVACHLRSSPTAAAAAASSRRTRTHAKDGELDLRTLQRKLETNNKLKEGLLDHPLDQAWQQFLTHLGRELWELDLCARLGAVLIVLGTIFQTIVMATFFPWYHPRTIVLVAVAAISAYYVLPRDFNPQALLSMMSLRRMRTAHVRYVLLGSLLVPTWLEARTLGYLTQVMCNAGLGYNLFVTTVIAGAIAYRRKYQPHLPLRHLFYTGLYILYGGAFWVSLLHFHIRDIPSTAGPFLLSSGTLLLAEGDRQQYTRALRHSLRLTLRDALAAVSDNVRKDELLQLAMLRWIVEYWSTRPVPSGTAPPPSTAAMEKNSLVTSNPVPVQLTRDRLLQHRPTERSSTNSEEIQWNDLLPMLDLTTDQMEDEVRYSANNEDNNAFESLRQMLASMDVDEHALPAVNEYKRAVEAFPPDRTTSLVISVLRRCPSTLLIIWRCLVASPFTLPSILTLLPFVILETHRVLYWAEACHRQADDGEHEPNGPTSFEIVTSIPNEIDSMSLLLSRDTFSLRGPPTLLQVWFNVQASVRALETGLSAARCAQTTVVAADFANNLMSLAELGCEVSQNGWIHGLSILAQELVHLQVSSREGRYTSAVIGALKNSQKIVRNLQVLAVEDAPIIAFLRTVVGRGWLWGHGEPPLPESTVVITELGDGEEVNMDEAQDDGAAAKAEGQQCMPDPSEKLTSDERFHKLDASCSAENDVLVKRDTDESAPCAVTSMANCLNNEEQHEPEYAKDEHVVSDLLELLDSAHERRLISDVVKISFEAMLSGEPTKAVVENVKISLSTMMEKGECQSSKGQHFQVGDMVESDDDDHMQRRLRGQPQIAAFPPSEMGQYVPEGSAGVLDLSPTTSNTGSITPKDAISTGMALGLSGISDIEPGEGCQIPVISNQSSWDETPFTENLSSNYTFDSATGSWEAFASQMLEPPSEAALRPEISRRLQLDPDDSQASTFPNHEGENDIKKWVGGGLAVIGAVIGTVALHNAQRGEGNAEHQDRSQPIGRVVELSSEIDDDGWVSIDNN